MPTTNIQLIEVKQRPNTSNIVFTAQSGNRIITREIDISEFDSWQQFAQWIINQEPEFILQPDKEKSLSIEWHTETLEDDTIRIVDNVTVT